MDTLDLHVLEETWVTVVRLRRWPPSCSATAASSWTVRRCPGRREMRFAMHTRLRSERIAEYEAAHRDVPAELIAAIRAGGAASWTIWRSGVDLFHVLECDDPVALFASLEGLPAQIGWATRMAEFVDESDGLSADGAATGLPVVWSL